MRLGHILALLALTVSGCTTPSAPTSAPITSTLPATPTPSCAQVILRPNASEVRIGENVTIEFGLHNCWNEPIQVYADARCETTRTFVVTFESAKAEYSYYEGTPNGTPIAPPPFPIFGPCPIPREEPTRTIAPGVTDVRSLLWNGTVSVWHLVWENTTEGTATSAYTVNASAPPGNYTLTMTFDPGDGLIVNATTHLRLLPRS
ncbi:MAG: hypothetical protein ACYDCK_04350 [Thermoplasmatota archaeon]